jgi:hypothetical protein
MATPTIVGYVNGTVGSSVTSASFTTPSGTAIGDLVLAFLYVEPTNEGTSSAAWPTLTPPSGWSQATGSPFISNPSTLTTEAEIGLYIFYGYASAAGAHAMTFTVSAAVPVGLVGFVVRGGPTSGQPFSETSSSVVAAAAALQANTNPVALTLAAANSMVLFVQADYWPGSFPTGYTGYAVASGGVVGGASLAYASAGSTGNLTVPRPSYSAGAPDVCFLGSLRAPATALANTHVGSSTPSVFYVGSGSVTAIYQGSTKVWG